MSKEIRCVLCENDDEPCLYCAVAQYREDHPEPHVTCVIEPCEVGGLRTVKPEPFQTGLACHQFTIIDTNGKKYKVMACTEVMVGNKNIGVYNLLLYES